MTASILRHTYPREMAPVVRNNAGGETHIVDKWNRLNRFLIIGTEGGTYYVGEKQHTLDNVKVVTECLDEDPIRVINLIEDISVDGRAPKNDYAIYALAMAASHSSAFTRQQALARLSSVCRTGTHLFQFIEAVDKMRGWGTGLRKAVANWYLSKDANSLAYQVLKYQQRNGWSHRDVFRKAHPVTKDYAKNLIIRYAVTGKLEEAFDEVGLIVARETAHMYNDPDITAGLIRSMNLSREMIPTEHMNATVVQVALAEKMPYTALMRNLGNLSKHGVLTDETLQNVIRRLSAEDYIKKSRVHPISVLTALRTYTQGTGYRSQSAWLALPEVTRALDGAFYKSFNNVATTGKRFMVGIDVSGSMSSRYGEGILTSAEIAAALAMMLVRTENWVKTYAFNNRLTKLNLQPEDSLETVLAKTRFNNFGGTNAGLLIEEAMRSNTPVDVFVTITDSESWQGAPTSRLLKQYRAQTGIDAKLVVLATEATQFSIADPNDPGMLDIAGFDSSVPDIIREFALGHI